MADRRVFMVMPSFITGAVRVELVDPTSCLYLATRTPELPTKALGARS